MEVLGDFTTTVEKALTEIDANWKEYDGLIICGTHSPHHIEEMIGKIKEYRETGKPFLGICFGHQLSAIEYARNFMRIEGATSEEFYEKESLRSKNEMVVIKREDGLKVGLHDGESYWNNYEVIDGFESIWKKVDNFITVQFHPEYQSSFEKPHPVLVKFLEACRQQKKL